MAEHVSYELSDGISTITINDGKVNVMSTAMLHEIGAALDRAESDKAVTILRSGRPGMFSAGFDLKVFASGDAAGGLEMVRTGAELAIRLLTFPLPTIGVMEGHAFPMGTFFLLGCDYRIASDGDHKMGLNEVAIGLTPPGFAIELTRSRMAPAWHSRTVTLGEMFRPQEALAAGLLDQVVAAGDLNNTLVRITSDLKKLHRPSHARAKQRLRHATIAAMREAMDRELTLEASQKSSDQTKSSVVLPDRSR